MAVFLNATAHDLTPQQIEEAKKGLGCQEIINLKDVSPDLFYEILHCDGKDEEEIESLAVKLEEEILHICEKYRDRLYIHLPIGSPVFMFIFGSRYIFSIEFRCNYFVFSHYEKKKDRSGKSVSEFKKFVVLRNIWDEYKDAAGIEDT